MGRLGQHHDAVALAARNRRRVARDHLTKPRQER